MSETMKLVKEYASFIRNKPSYKRWKKRMERDGRVTNREEYELVTKAYRRAKKTSNVPAILTADELLGIADVDTEKWEVEKKVVNWWDSKYQIKLAMRRRDEAIPQPEKVTFEPNSTATKCVDLPNTTTTFVIPDAQIGFRYDDDGNLVPFHDDAAIKVVVNAIRELLPERIVVLGDFLDFPVMSRYRKHPSIRQLTNAAISYAYQVLASIRAAVPSSTEIYYLEGNHEARLRNSIVDMSEEHATLKRANSSKNVVSVPYILRLDELGIQYIGPYGKERLVLDDVLYVHGDMGGSFAGDTVSKYLKRYNCSVVFGHTHKVELGFNVEYGLDARRTFAMCPGSLCNLNGTPGAKQYRHTTGFGLVRNVGGVSVPEVVPILRNDKGEPFCVVSGFILGADYCL